MVSHICGFSPAVWFSSEPGVFILSGLSDWMFEWPDVWVGWVIGCLIVAQEKHQEVCSLQSRAEVAACTQRWQQEEIGNLRAELQSVRQSITQKLEAEKRTEVAAYKKQVQGHRPTEVHNVRYLLLDRMLKIQAWTCCSCCSSWWDDPVHLTEC